MSFYISKKNGELIFRNISGYETRNESTFWCIKKADEIYKWKDFEEIKICTHDFEYFWSDFSYSKQNSFYRLIPDFNFHAWPQVGIEDYEKTIIKIQKAGLKKFQLNKIGWIGNIQTNFMRKKLFELGETNKNMMDIFEMTWNKSNSIVLNSTNYISLENLVKKYSILLDIEGNGYSGRLKYLLWSHRPVIIVDRPHKEYFFEHLKEWEHYIPVKRDLSDLIEKAFWIFTHYEEAKKIAYNAFLFSKKYLTRKACYKKWNEIIYFYG